MDLVIGLEAKAGGECGSCGISTVTCCIAEPQKVFTVSISKAGLVPSREGGEANDMEGMSRDASDMAKGGDSTTSGKINSSEYGSSMSPFPSGSSSTLPSQLAGSHSFQSVFSL